MYGTNITMCKDLFDCMNLNIDETSEEYIRIKSEQAITQEEFAANHVSTAPHGSRVDGNFTPLP